VLVLVAEERPAGLVEIAAPGGRGEGARDEEGFKRWTREHQMPTQVWWTGISGSTVQNVRDDLWIRRCIERPLDEEETRAWLRRL